MTNAATTPAWKKETVFMSGTREYYPIGVRSRAKRLHLMESGCDEELLRRMFGNDAVSGRTEASIGTGPVDEEEFAIFPEDALRLRRERFAIIHLEEDIGSDDGIKNVVAELRAALTFEIAPYGLDVGAPLVPRSVPQAPEHVFLHVYRVYPALAAHDSRSGKRIVPASGAEIADLHAFTEAELEDIRRRIRETHTHKIPCAAASRPRSQHDVIQA